MTARNPHQAMITRHQVVVGGICVVAVVMLCSGVVAAGIESQTPPEPYASSTTTSGEECDGSVESNARISHSSIHAVDDTITTDEPASVAGDIVTPHSNQCVVVVQVIMNVPTDMYVSGTSGISSGGQGTLSSTFRLAPGTTKSLGARVYASSPGTRVITADFSYYPAGYPSKTRRLSGYSVPIEATQEHMPDENSADSTADSGGGKIPISLILWPLALGGVYYFATRR